MANDEVHRAGRPGALRFLLHRRRPFLECIGVLILPGGEASSTRRVDLFDDLDWMAAAEADRYRFAGQALPAWLTIQTDDELQTPQVRKIWELLVKQHPRFEAFQEEGQWGFARKRP